MGVDRPPLGRGEPGVVVHDVEQRLVDLADVVKERHPLDRALRMLVEVGGVGDDQRVGRHPAHVHAGVGIVGLDGVEQRLERCAGEPLHGLAGAALANHERSAGGGGGSKAQGRWEVMDPLQSQEPSRRLPDSLGASGAVWRGVFANGARQ